MTASDVYDFSQSSSAELRLVNYNAALAEH